MKDLISDKITRYVNKHDEIDKRWWNYPTVSKANIFLERVLLFNFRCTLEIKQQLEGILTCTDF